MKILRLVLIGAAFAAAGVAQAQTAQPQAEQSGYQGCSSRAKAGATS